ncbi:hypothetical protein FuraDRAFT_3671 [Pseudogulbenkiania ferrooxidans 2002]|uniref:Uncharacterized protein n=1 Tax=Pseudogulbenkiania ferrooxidans 2002 TaxID=279714 RepID=B9Z8I5_9NEIS|nr:hypothetical protein FuraDRAFT_3671 [Pseudogulbenkiania ferrooxidans 2002]
MQPEIHLAFLYLLGWIGFLLLLCLIGLWWNSR